MSRRPSGRLPVDRALDRPASPSPQYSISTEGLDVTPMTDERLWDARRAVTFVHAHPERFPAYFELGAIAEVFAALGLLPERPAAVEAGGTLQPIEVRCPFCEALPGVRCHNDRGGERPMHADRKRLAQRSTPEKENPTDE